MALHGFKHVIKHDVLDQLTGHVICDNEVGKCHKKLNSRLEGVSFSLPYIKPGCQHHSTKQLSATLMALLLLSCLWSRQTCGRRSVMTHSPYVKCHTKSGQCHYPLHMESWSAGPLQRPQHCAEPACSVVKMTHCQEWASLQFHDTLKFLQLLL